MSLPLGGHRLCTLLPSHHTFCIHKPFCTHMASTSRTKRQRSSRAQRDEVVQPNVIPIANVVAPPELDTYGIQFTSPKQVSRFQNLQGWDIQPTKFCDLETLRTLGISQDVITLFGRLGWHGFLNLTAHTYRALTLSSSPQWRLTRKTV